MQYPVPKFIERELKIWGPITLKLFVILVFVAGILFILYVSLPKKIFNLILIFVVPLVLISLFAKFEGTPLYQIYPKIFTFLFSPRVFVWRGKRGEIREIKIEKKAKIPLEKRKSAFFQKKLFVETRQK